MKISKKLLIPVLAAVLVLALALTLFLLFGKFGRKSVMDYIEMGEYQKAYDLLIAIENPTEEEKQLLKRFRFLALEIAGTNGEKEGLFPFAVGFYLVFFQDIAVFVVGIDLFFTVGAGNLQRQEAEAL